MKKLFMVAAVSVACLSLTFAIDMSVGANARLDSGTTTTKTSFEILGIDIEKESKSSMTNFGGEAFFDATYLKAGIGFNSLMNYKYKADSDSDWETVDDVNMSYLTFNVYGKYPIALGPVALFPTLGLEYMSNVSLTDEDGTDMKESMTDDQKANYNELWLKGGLGLDFPINTNLYVRATGLFGYKFNSTYVKDAISDMEELGGDLFFTTLGYEITLGIGYKF